MFLAHIGPFFSILGQKIFFLRNPALSRTTSYEFPSTMPNFRKNLIQLQENASAEGLMEGWKDGQTLFYRTLSAAAEGPKTD